MRIRTKEGEREWLERDRMRVSCVSKKETESTIVDRDY